MPAKKSDAKFTIQFSQTDPAHLQVAGILNRQGWHGKAQYIVEAVMHYVNCSGVREFPPPARLDEKHIEAVVNRILRDSSVGGPSSGTASALADSVLSSASYLNASELSGKTVSGEIIYNEAVEALGEDGLDVVVGMLDMFRIK